MDEQRKTANLKKLGAALNRSHGTIFVPETQVRNHWSPKAPRAVLLVLWRSDCGALGVGREGRQHAVHSAHIVFQAASSLVPGVTMSGSTAKQVCQLTGRRGRARRLHLSVRAPPSSPPCHPLRNGVKYCRLSWRAARHSYLHCQEQHLFGKAATLSPRSVDILSHATCKNSSGMTCHLVIRGAATVSMLIALVDKLRNMSVRVHAAWRTVT